MSVREEYRFESQDDKKTMIHGVKWTPEDGKIRGVLQICHGMQEYIDRYQELADFMTSHGFAVVGHDHIGHGESVASPEELGIMHTNTPAETMVADMFHNYQINREQYSDVPYFILGHSMGSYLLRMMLSMKAEELKDLNGAIIMGTGSEADSAIKAGRFVVNLVGAIHGWDYKSKFVAGLMFGKPYKGFNIDGTVPEESWLSKNVEDVKKYYSNPLNNYAFSVNGYRLLLTATAYDNQLANIRKINKDLPIHFMSGACDPVGNLGKGVKDAFCRFQEAGIADVTMKLYKNDRHEILNELDRDQVREDLLAWIEEHM